MSMIPQCFKVAFFVWPTVQRSRHFSLMIMSSWKDILQLIIHFKSTYSSSITSFLLPACLSRAAAAPSVTFKVSPSAFTVVGAASAGVKVASARLPSPKTLVGSPAQILAQFPKQQSPKQLQQSSPLGVSSVSQTQTTSSLPGSKPTIQIKQESGEPTKHGLSNDLSIDLIIAA